MLLHKSKENILTSKTLRGHYYYNACCSVKKVSEDGMIAQKPVAHQLRFRNTKLMCIHGSRKHITVNSHNMTLFYKLQDITLHISNFVIIRI
jgi:hypothetical protein